jgi:hypothetical protein
MSVEPDDIGSRDGADGPVLPHEPGVPVMPVQSSEDTDVGWGDYAEPDDDDRFIRDRPPHWDDA